MDNRSNRRPNGSGRSAGSYGASRQTYASRPASAQPRRAGSSTRAGSARTASQTTRARTDRPSAPSSRSASHSASNRGGRAPSRPMPRRRRDPSFIIFLCVIALAILAGAVYAGSAWFISAVNGSTYCSNIYINNIEVSRYSKEQGAQFIRDQVDAQLNTDYQLSWGENSWSFTPADFGASIETDTVMERAWNIGHVGNIFDRSASIRALKQNPVYLTTALTYDEESIDAYLSGIYDALYLEPKSATVAADISNPYLAEAAEPGQELDVDAARMQIVSLIETGEGGSVLPVIELEPELSTDAALNSLELIVDYTTDTTARGYNGRYNVRKALMAFYGMIVQPGEEVSFNQVVGPRNEERGWQLGTEYLGGGKTQQGYGGGICQASTTLYGALLKSGMTIMFRYPHSMTVAYVDPSIDAAVTEDGKDLVFRNDTDNPITIYTEVTKEVARVQIYGTKQPYRYELESIIVEQHSAASRVGFIEDTEGTHCYYTDEFELYKKGIPACLSQGWLVAYDWETGEEVSRTHLSNDVYASGTDIYWRGIHDRDGGLFLTGEEADGL